MKIGIISDTHIDKHADRIIDIVGKYMKDVDLIVHAGDFKNAKVVNMLKQYKNFVGVWGNVDHSSVKEILNEKEIFRAEGYRIGVFHGHGEGKTTLDRAYDMFKDDDIDIIVFGHSHQPVIEIKNKILMLNPGSPTYKRKGKWFSYIILDLQKGNVSASLKLFAPK